MTFGLQSINGARPGAVDYRLQRRTIISEYRKKRLAKHQVCDAHPELVRAGRELGEVTSVDCPICATDPPKFDGEVKPERKLRLVTYVFGARLPSFGRCISKKSELVELSRRPDPLTAYVVEVCPDCGWNWLARSFAIGGRRPVKGRRPAMSAPSE
jgi:hypothetical protein